MNPRTLLFVTALLATVSPLRSLASDPARIERLPITTGAQADAAAAKYFTDTELVDQDGKPRRFYSDLIRGRRC
jgi:protein SCO1/2